ncbi:NAD(P)/FAD-dependent oxidoreductase [Algirhabdus cladophorae]|uniref:NAD(P)/FAD-dependent oxidoreductase n=1 Tax=Algirhabdus cladophorae TaxID=3377108 RepID=UPI003B845423
MIDFLVIGGGIAGTSAAAMFAPLGTTTLLEAENTFAHHASGRSAAIFVEDYGNDVVCALNTASMAELQDMGALSARGLLMVGPRGHEVEFDGEVRLMQIEEIPFSQAQTLFPILNPTRCTRTAYTDQAFDLDTDLMMQSYMRAARGDGADLCLDQKVEKITKITQGWMVETKTDSFSAHILINAAGPWADDIAKMAGVVPLGIQPMRRSMAQLPPPNGQNMSDWPMIISSAGDWYARPSGASWLVSPSEAVPCEPHDAWANDMTIAEGLSRYEGMVTVPVSRVQSSWAGLRSFAPDQSLIIGPDPISPDFLWFAGQGGYGFQTAPAAATLLALLANGRESDALSPETVAALSPARFH